MHIPTLSPNLLIISTLIVAAGYGLVAGKQLLRILILSVYVGLVLSGDLTALLHPMFKLISSEQLSLILLGAPILIFGLVPQKGGGGHEKGSAIANAIVGLLTGALIVAAALKVIPVSDKAIVDGNSYIGVLIGNFSLWFIGGLPLVALVLGMIHKKEGGKHH